MKRRKKLPGNLIPINISGSPDPFVPSKTSGPVNGNTNDRVATDVVSSSTGATNFKNESSSRPQQARASLQSRKAQMNAALSMRNESEGNVIDDGIVSGMKVADNAAISQPKGTYKVFKAKR